MSDVKSKEILKGGAFLIKSQDEFDFFTPEDFDEEQKMIYETVKDFIATQIAPNKEKIEKQENNIAADLLEKFAELGFLGTHMPEEYGGLKMDFNSNTIIGEAIGPSASFSVAYNAHSGIGMLPILYFGTEEQKQKYLPGLITAELKASYCLTEPSSGSDALSAKTTAVLSEDGEHYILNGQKMWITNAGFADVFTVFAQVDGDKFTAFIVEKGTEGLSLGEEEKKMGIKGSSTRMVFLEDVKVPKENLLGEVGKGHLIAFNALNTGRFKLGSSVLGGAKAVLDDAVKYAKERTQFKQPIANFGAIKSKIAEMAIQNFALESALYRTSHFINEDVHQRSENADYGKAKLEAAAEYAIESSILKIYGSEVLDYCVDENVQIHGGMGFSEEADAARAYRDSRINRIFEGTNEINRLVVLNTLMKRAMKGQLDIVTPALAVQSELKGESEESMVFSESFKQEKIAVHNYKKILLMTLGSAAKKAMDGSLDLKTEQELVMNLSDIIIDIFNLESMLGRVLKMEQNGYTKNDKELYVSMLEVAFYDANHRIYKNALDAMSAFIKLERQGDFIAGYRKFTKYPVVNVKDARRKIADRVLEKDGYCF